MLAMFERKEAAIQRFLHSVQHLPPQEVLRVVFGWMRIVDIEAMADFNENKTNTLLTEENEDGK